MKKIHILAALLCALPPLAFAADDVSSIENPAVAPEVTQTQQAAPAPAATIMLEDDIKMPMVSETTRAPVFNSMLDEVVVTATRIEQPLRQVLSSTTVITQEDINNSQAADVPAILRSLAGVEISQTGGYGKASSLYLRGNNSTHTLVLLDGVRISSATLGTIPIEHLMLAQIERIEVVRGNVSSLYGSEAIGGVIQIFTKRGKGDPVFNVSSGGGTHGTQSAAAGLGGKIEKTDFNLQISKFKTDGVSALNPALFPLSVNPDNDGYDNTSVSGNIRHAFNADHSLAVTAFNSLGYSQYDSSFGSSSDINSSESQVRKFSLTADNNLTKSWLSKLLIAQGSDSYKDFINGLPVAGGSLYKTTNQQLSWLNTLQLGTGMQLLAGAEYLGQQVTSDLQPAYVQDERRINSLFSGYTGNYGVHQLQANLRQDINSQYGIANTGLLGYGYAFNDAWRATTRYSTAFRAPTFNDLYFPGYGNPNVRPEQSRNIEAGLHYSDSAHLLGITYFDNRIKDLINAVEVDPATFTYQAQNVGKARIDGLEFSYAGQLGDTSITTAVTLQNPYDITNNKPLDRRSTKHSNVAVTHKLGALQIGGEWLYSDTRPDGTRTLAAYHVFNLTAAYALSKQTKLSLRADNLTDQNNSNAYGYNPLGRTFFANLSYQQ